MAASPLLDLRTSSATLSQQVRLCSALLSTQPALSSFHWLEISDALSVLLSYSFLSSLSLSCFLSLFPIVVLFLWPFSQLSSFSLSIQIQFSSQVT